MEASLSAALVTDQDFGPQAGWSVVALRLRGVGHLCGNDLVDGFGIIDSHISHDGVPFREQGLQHRLCYKPASRYQQLYCIASKGDKVSQHLLHLLDTAGNLVSTWILYLDPLHGSNCLQHEGVFPG